MKASKEARKFAAEAAKSDSKLAYDLLAFADRLAEDEQEQEKQAGQMPPWLKDKVEEKKDDEKKDEKKEASQQQADQEEQQKQAARYTSLKSLVIKQASNLDPSARAPFLPLLKAIKDLG